MEHLERENLAPYACRSAESRGRAYPSDPHPYRTEYQKDRDRIIHTTAFRRLQYKTQVFVNYEGDYYRTRLTHTNEAAQIARTVARALAVNVDLVEAIALAHDLGHSAFGHSGEETLDRLMLVRMGLDPNEPGNRGLGFNHTVQSLRVVEHLENRWPEHRGLNLTWETREGIVKHDTSYDAVPLEWRAPYEPDWRPALEAQIVNFADELTYSAHDLDDGLRSGLLRAESPELGQIELWSRARFHVEDDDDELRRHRTIRRLIDILVSDLVFASAEKIASAAPNSPDDVRRHPVMLIGLSNEMQPLQQQLQDFLFKNLYRHYRVIRMHRKAEMVLQALFTAFEEDYRQLPTKTRARMLEVQPDIRPGGELTTAACRVIADYLAGMTDRFAVQEYERLLDPRARA